MKKHIFLIEDNSTQADNIAEYLDDCNYDVNTSYSYGSALKKFNKIKKSIDLLIVDIDLGENDKTKDGVRLVKEFNKLGNTTPVLFLTASPSIKDVTRARNQLNFYDYLLKDTKLKEQLLIKLDCLFNLPNPKQHYPITTNIIIKKLDCDDISIPTHDIMIASSKAGNYLSITTKDARQHLTSASPMAIIDKLLNSGFTAIGKRGVYINHLLLKKYSLLPKMVRFTFHPNIDIDFPYTYPSSLKADLDKILGT